MRLVFFGTPHFVIPVLEMLDKNYDVAAVVTTPDAKVGRKQILTPTPVALYAKKHNIPVLKPEKLTNLIQNSGFMNLESDIFVVAAYGKIIPQEILNIPSKGALNIHPSLLPKYRGPSPLQAAILNGDEISGISIIKMDAQMDHGPIVAATEFILSEQDTFDSLSTKIFESGSKLLESILPQYIEENIYLKPQDDSKATYCQRTTKEDGYFDINNPPTPEILDRIIRAYYPWPTVWTKWEGKIVKFLPGGLIQMEGKKPMPLKDFLNGYPNFPLDNLGE